MKAVAAEPKLAILFSAAMIRALIAGRKRVTRRIVRQGVWRLVDGLPKAAIGGDPKCPYGEPGDLLRVKEAAWMWCERVPNGQTRTGRPRWRYVPMRGAPVYYAADHPSRPAEQVPSADTGNHWGWHLKIGRFLPAWASRITITLKARRVERLQEITEGDAELEGVGFPLAWEGPDSPYRTAFSRLWEAIHGADSWAMNPYVWVISFNVAEVRGTSSPSELRSAAGAEVEAQQLECVAMA